MDSGRCPIISPNFLGIKVTILMGYSFQSSSNKEAFDPYNPCSTIPTLSNSNRIHEPLRVSARTARALITIYTTQSCVLCRR